MDQLTAVLLTKALDGLSLRATAIAQNIANANSPNYSPLRVSFEESLRRAADAGPEAVHKVEPELVRALPETADRDVRLDLEMASASQTALRYAALIDVLNRRLQLTHMVAKGSQ